MIEKQVEFLFETAQKHVFEFPKEARGRFLLYGSLIRKTTSSFNLVSKNEIERLGRRHFLDSLSPLLFGIIKPPAKLLDIGSGAGLPGIPLAIAEPGLEISMLESVSKKARFIDMAIKEIGLRNAEILDIRLEKLPQNPIFEYCTARAVSSIEKLLPSIYPHLKTRGKAIFFKGQNPEREIEKARIISEEIGFQNPTVFKLPDDLSPCNRTLVVYEKT